MKVLITLYITILSLFVLVISNSIESCIIMLFGLTFIFFLNLKSLLKLQTDKNGLLIYYWGFIFSSIFVYFNYIFLLNPSGAETNLVLDAKLYHDLASQIVDSNDLSAININYIGYPLILSVLYLIFTKNFLLGILLSLYAFIASIVLLRKLTLLVFRNDMQKGKLANYSMLLFIAVPYLLRSGTLLIKDSLIVLSFLIIVNVIIQFKFEKLKISDYIKSIIAIVIIGLLRAPYLLFIPIIFLMFSSLRNIRQISLFVFTSLLLVFIFQLSFKYSTYDSNIESLSETYIVRDAKVSPDDSNSAVKALIGVNYKSKNIIGKMLFLPLTVGVQVIFPLPFVGGIQFDKSPPISTYSTHMNFLWYLVFFLIVYYFVFNKRKDRNIILKRIMILGALLFLVPAFTEGGVTPRYATPFISMLIPGAAYSFNTVLHRRKSLENYSLLLGFSLIFFVILYVLLKSH